MRMLHHPAGFPRSYCPPETRRSDRADDTWLRRAWPHLGDLCVHAPDRAAQSVPHPCFVSRPDSDRQTISQSLNRNTVRSSGSDTGSKQPDQERENTFRESEAGKNPQACGTGAVKDRSERKPEASRAMAVFDLLSGCPYIDLR
jgi:hypothetical protein